MRKNWLNIIKFLIENPCQKLVILSGCLTWFFELVAIFIRFLKFITNYLFLQNLQHIFFIFPQSLPKMPRKAATKAKVTTKFEEPAPHSEHSLSEYETSTSLTKRSNPYASYDSPDDSPYEKKSVGSEDDGDIESSRTRKIRVQKCYEPLMDNGILYVYNDNPEEYKKARK